MLIYIYFSLQKAMGSYGEGSGMDLKYTISEAYFIN